jgi:hypothetical protein
VSNEFNKPVGLSIRKSVSRRHVLAMAAEGLGAALVAGPLARASAAEQRVTGPAEEGYMAAYIVVL